MIRLLPKDLFKKELLKTIFILAGIFILATIIIIFFRGYHTLEKFRKTSHLNELILEKDFYMIQSIYPSQLEYLKNEIKKIGLNNKKLELYFHSHRALLPDQLNVNSLIITNKERKVIYSDLHWMNGDDESDLKERKYLKSLENSPNQIIFNNFTKIVSESPSGNFTIPIATGIVDNENLFIGTIVVNVSTGSFSKNFLEGDLFSISVSDKSVITDEFWDSSYFKKMWLLLFSSQKISKIFYSKYIDKQIDLKYQPDYHRQKFIKKTIEGGIITFIILLIIFIFYYFNILSPLRRALHF